MADITQQLLEAQQETNRLLRSRGTGGVDLQTSGASATGYIGFFKSLSSGQGITDSLLGKFKELGTQLSALNDQYKEATNVGLSMNKDMFKLNSELTAAHITVDQFRRIVEFTGTQNFAGLNKGMNASATEFLSIAGRLQASGLSASLQQLGLGYLEQNELLAISIDRNKENLVTDKLTGKVALSQELSDRIFSLSKNIALNTDLLGVSRDDQLKALSKAQTDADVQIAERALGGKFKDFYDKQLPLLDALNSPELKKMSLGMQLNSDEMTRFRLQFQGDANKMEAMARAISQAKDAGGEKRALDQMNVTMTSFMQRQSPENLYRYNQAASLRAQASPEFGEADKAYKQSVIATASLYQRMFQDGILVKNFGEVREASIEEIRKNLLDKNGQPSKDMDPGAKTTVIVQEGLSRVADMNVTLARTIETLAIKVGQSEKLVDRAMIALGPEKVFGPDTQLKIANTLTNSVSAFLGWVFGEKTAKDMANKITSEFGSMLKDVKNQVVNINDAKIKDTNNNEFAEGTPGVNAFLKGGSFSSIFENFGNGTPATLHGMEAVVRPEQLMGIVNKMAGEAVNTVTNAQKDFQTSASSVTPVVNDQHYVDIKQLLGQLNTLMSHLPGIADTMDKQYSALKSLNNDALQS